MSMSPTIHNAIISLCPEARLEIQGKQIYSNIKWLDNLSSHPTEAEVDTEIIRLQAEHDAQAYSRKREAEYPSVQECVHAILDDTLDALQAKRAEIKTKYPKGG